MLTSSGGKHVHLTDMNAFTNPHRKRVYAVTFDENKMLVKSWNVGLVVERMEQVFAYIRLVRSMSNFPRSSTFLEHPVGGPKIQASNWTVVMHVIK